MRIKSGNKVWNKESSIWKESTMKALVRRAQVKHIDVGEIRGGHEQQVEQIKGEKFGEHRDGLWSKLKSLDKVDITV